MNALIRIFLAVLLLACMMLVSQCSKDDGESADAKTKRQLQSTWRVEKVTTDGVDETALYPNLTLTIGAGTYTSRNGEPIWPVSGTWTLTDAKTITRDNDLPVTIETLDETTLTLSFTWTKTTYAGGRMQSLSGVNVFQFQK